MTEEEYFRKNYPNSCYGDKPLSPHWDFFQNGVEFGERQSEKRIEELEATNKTISNECHKLVDTLEKKQNEVAELQHLIKTQDRKLRQQSKVCDEAIDRVETLVKENTELKSELTKKADTNHSLVEQMADLESKNAELKEQNTNLQEMLKTERSVTCKEEYLKKVTELEQENAELKAVERMALYSRMSDLLAKAKELLERLLITSCNSDVLNQYPNCSEVLKVRVEAEQFLNSEVKK